MKKIAFAAIAAGFAMSSAVSAATVEQTRDVYAYELGGVGVVTQMQADRSFGVRNVQPTNATIAPTSGSSIGYNMNIANPAIGGG